MIWGIVSAGLLAAAITMVGCPTNRRGRGRHVSRPLTRRLGWSRYRVWRSQSVLLMAGSAFSFAGVLIGTVTVLAAYVVWTADDWITGDDDDDKKRKHEWAKIRLRMPKPIKLRAAERFPAPAPA